MPISRIKTDGINDDAITSAKIGVDVIVADDLAANSVTVSELTNNAVTTAKIANGAITDVKLATDSVGTDAIGTGVVGTTQIAADAVTGDKLANNITIAGTTTSTGALTASATSTLVGSVTHGTDSGDTRFNFNGPNQYRLTIKRGGNIAGQIGGGGADDLRFSNAAGATTMTLKSGKLGIGTSSPTQEIHGYSSGGDFSLKLESASATGTAYTMYKNADQEYAVGIRGSAADTFQIIDFTADATRLTVDTSGRVGIGTSSMDSRFEINSTQSATSRIRLKLNDSPYCYFGGYSGIVGSGNADDVALYAWTSKQLMLGTNATERMRISANGLVTFNGDKNGSSDAQVNIVQNESGGLYRCLNLYTGQTGNRILQTFFNGNGQVGYINTSGSTTYYNTSSDYRLKENVTADWDATTRLKQLNPVRFNFIADADTTVDGFLAHEVQSIVPEAITGEKDAVDADGNPEYQGIDQNKLVPLLVKTIQELEARITALESN
jgi:hypothetical protein